MKQQRIATSESSNQLIDDDFLQNLLNQAEELNSSIARLAKQKPSLKSRQVSTEKIAELAKGLHASRENRRRHLDVDLFGEPAWDILLDLYVQEQRVRRVSVTSCCLAAGVPATTALRWIGVLENRSLIVRRNDGNDGRRHHIYLTTKGREALELVLRDMYAVLKN